MPRCAGMFRSDFQAFLQGLLGAIEVQAMRRTAHEPLFNSLMEQYHYLSYEQPVGEHGPAATVWETQQGMMMVIPEEGPLPPGPAFLRSLGRKVACWLPLTTAHRRVGAPGECYTRVRSRHFLRDGDSH